MNIRNRLLLLMLTAGSLFTNCTKYLDGKPDKSLAVPATLSDLQALLDNNYLMNVQAPMAGEASADNYYLTDDSYNSLWSPAYQNMYTWGEEITYDVFPSDWEIGYDQVYVCNTVLETIAGLTRSAAEADAWDNVKGSALYYRANAFLKVAYTWAPAYDSATSGEDMGIPLRLHSDFENTSVRASVRDTYAQITSDLREAIPLLPLHAITGMRPNRAAGYALLARAYLAMRAYEPAGRYADTSLLLYHTLMNYNDLPTGTGNPFAPFNEETLVADGGYNPCLADYAAKTDTTLYRSYADNDLRKALFFKNNGDGSYAFQGSYFGYLGMFTGVATDEVYLMRAECEARSGETGRAIADLNTLLRHRYQTGSFTDVNAATANEALTLILQERRKELLMRDLRWMDLKRLNKEADYESVITRRLNGETLTLPPNDPRYALPLPRSVIQLTGMPQNPR